MAYGYNLAILINNINYIQPQINKLQKLAEWAYMKLNVAKCAITRSPNKTKLKPIISKTLIHAQRITYKEKQFPMLTQNEPYTYLGIQPVPSPKWQIQKDMTMKKTTKQNKLLLASPITIRQINQNPSHRH